ncbi:MAG: orotidine-5'-phosphate decarboxylase [Balneolia bacterium]|nr:orotidine-5'-phosphate decarboxylase [Balneolia bacterium]
MTFPEKLKKALDQTGSSLMIGLDPVFTKLPVKIQKQVASETEAVRIFCQDIIEHTLDSACGYKLNLAFFEALGDDGLEVFHEVCSIIPDDKIVLADAKRGDIGNTAAMYATAFFDRFGCDAVTVNPLMGMETLLPFLQDETKSVFALALTSNPGAADLLLQKLENGKTVAVHLASEMATLQQSEEVKGTIGMVTGATQTDKLRDVIAAFPGAPLLIPGIGSQGGAPEAVVSLMKDFDNQGIPVISRSIIYAFEQDDPHWVRSVQKAARSYSEEFAGLVR